MEKSELDAISRREREAAKPIRISCCTAAGCLSAHSGDVLDGIRNGLKNSGLEKRVEARGVGCMKLCSRGPLVRIDTLDDGIERDGANVLYERVTQSQAGKLVDSAGNGKRAEHPTIDLERPFFTRQKPIVLENCGRVDPERIESYILAGGYIALYRALRDMAPEEVLKAITRSGLRGRGGAGFPTGVKWSLVAKTAADRKYVICNADEGDPGAFMDRSVLESDPHKILEGMAIAAYAVGASEGYIYIRGEYPLAINRLQTAIRSARRKGLIGGRIFDSPFDFNIDLRIGAGAFVCGEETALMASIEGKRGNPTPRPPYPAEHGLWGNPTLINNVETFANVAPIIRNGPEWFASVGTEKSKGTKVFALAGKINNTGLIEVPMGITLREIVEEIGGGVPEGQVKAVQTGGPSGGCIPREHLETSVDYESLAELGSIMGSGGMIVMDQSTNMVDVARFFMEFCMDESCGKCLPCRAGTVQMHSLLEKIRDGRATPDDLALLEELCDMVKHTSLCGLGQTAPNPVMSTLRFFRDEYEQLLNREATTA